MHAIRGLTVNETKLPESSLNTENSLKIALLPLKMIKKGKLKKERQLQWVQDSCPCPQIRGCWRTRSNKRSKSF